MLAPALLLAAGRLAALALAAVQLWLLAGLPPEATGLVLLHAGLWAAWAVAIDLGTGQALLRLCAPRASPDLRLGPDGERLVRGAVRLRLRLGSLALVGHLALAIALGDGGDLWLLAATLHMPAQALGALQTPFLLRGTPLPLVGVRFAGLALSLGGTALLRLGRVESPGPYLAAQAFGMLLSLWLLHARAGIALCGKAAPASELLPESLLLGLGGFVRGLYFHGGQLLVRLIAPSELALFAVPYRVFQVALLLPQSLGDLLLGPLTREQRTDPGRAAARVRRLSSGLFLLGGLTAGLGLLLATPVLTLIGGQTYAESAPVLRVLLLAVPLVHVASVLLTAALAGGRLKGVLILSLAGLIATSVLCLAFVPGHGALGAAWAACGTEALILAGALWLSRTPSKMKQEAVA